VPGSLAGALAALAADKLLLDDVLAGGGRRRARLATAAAASAAASAPPAAEGSAGQLAAQVGRGGRLACGACVRWAARTLRRRRRPADEPCCNCPRPLQALSASVRDQEAVAELRSQVRCLQLMSCQQAGQGGHMTLEGLKQQLSNLQVGG
jgi:hypothetical protein